MGVVSLNCTHLLWSCTVVVCSACVFWVLSTWGVNHGHTKLYDCSIWSTWCVLLYIDWVVDYLGWLPWLQCTCILYPMRQHVYSCSLYRFWWWWWWCSRSTGHHLCWEHEVEESSIGVHPTSTCDEITCYKTSTTRRACDLPISGMLNIIILCTWTADVQFSLYWDEVMWGTFHTTGISVCLYIHTPPVLSLVFLHVWHCKYVGGDGGNRQLQGMSSPLEYNNPNIV